MAHTVTPGIEKILLGLHLTVNQVTSQYLYLWYFPLTCYSSDTVIIVIVITDYLYTLFCYGVMVLFLTNTAFYYI